MYKKGKIYFIDTKVIFCNFEKVKRGKDTNTLFLFTDGSVNTKLNFGYGAYLAVIETKIQTDNLEQLVEIKRFEETSSVKLELQTLLWALNEIQYFDGEIILYTDSQNIIGLPGRRERLEKNDFYSKNIDVLFSKDLSIAIS